MKRPSDHGQERTVTVLRRSDCAHGTLAVDRVKSLADELGLQVAIDEVLIETVHEAEEHRCLGSPTIRIRGQDIERDARRQTSYGVT